MTTAQTRHRSIGMILGAVILLLAGLTSPAAARSAQSGHGHDSGEALPASARPYGISLSEMARRTALFTTNQNDLRYYPRTPLQVLYAVQPFDFSDADGGWTFSGGNSLTVRPGTMFYVPLQNATNSPPITGTWPENERQARRHFFDESQLGAKGFKIVIDGRATSVGPNYLAGPVRTPPLGDGGGDEIITLGVFVGALSPGTHTVQISGRLAGADLRSAYDINFLAGDFTYTVTVRK